MKRHFRKIVVDNIEYKWLYRYDDYDCIFDPYLLIVPEAEPKTELKVLFGIKDHYALNSGFPAAFNEGTVAVNLNQPAYVSQIIRQCIKLGVDFEEKRRWSLNGVEILRQLGYNLHWK